MEKYIPCSLDSSKIQVTTVKERTQLGLQGKFPNSQGSTEKPCLEKNTNKEKKRKEGREGRREKGKKGEREGHREKNQNHILK